MKEHSVLFALDRVTTKPVATDLCLYKLDERSRGHRGQNYPNRGKWSNESML
jgi:hypothetical protein